MSKAKLVMMRHGQSEWNKLNLFTGWVDIPLSVEGIQEALDAGKKIAHIPFDVIFISSLVRAEMTAMLVMSVHDSKKVPRILHRGQGKLEEWAQIYSKEAEKTCTPVIAAWQLNERMYGRLQGMNKREMMDKYGEEQVKIWRRSFDVAPPEGESLAMTAARAIPYFKEMVVPYLEAGKNVFISAHGNSLRAIMMHLDGLTKEQVVELELPTGKPVIYNFHDHVWEKEPSVK
ncbi:MAG: 2,3-bisphosphoglycerate-dependent phosphoglycerate mutase [Chlamydiales bacterium]|nr:2,3-bisphosphoglycerate-dependent phosphoglycerate mutase [Chlamydiales bacterium]